MEESLKKQGIDKKYVFLPTQPEPIPKFIDNFTAIDFVFNDPERFCSGYKLTGLGDGYGFMIAIDEKKRHYDDKAMVSAKLAVLVDGGLNEFFAIGQESYVRHG